MGPGHGHSGRQIGAGEVTTDGHQPGLTRTPGFQVFEFRRVLGLGFNRALPKQKGFRFSGLEGFRV